MKMEAADSSKILTPIYQLHDITAQTATALSTVEAACYNGG